MNDECMSCFPPKSDFPILFDIMRFQRCFLASESSPCCCSLSYLIRCVQCLLLVFTVSALVWAFICNTNVGPKMAAAFIHRRGTITGDAIFVYAVVAEEGKEKRRRR